MTVPLQQFEFDRSTYERPEQRWACGWASQGHACRIGPDGRGRCRASTECQPIRKEDRWICTRPNVAGGRCERGPLPDGRCCRNIPRCQPVRNMRSRRGVTAAAFAMLLLGALVALLTGPGRERFLSAGPLSMNHAQLEQDCGACHRAGGASLIAMLESSMAPADPALESDNCLKCHRDLGVSRLTAHSLPPERLNELTEQAAASAHEESGPLRAAAARWMTGNLSDPHQLACALCHVEHRGREASLTSMDTIRCQSCHRKQFQSFTEGHPDFSPSYPTARRTRILFNHKKHLQSYFPDARAGGAALDASCESCHAPDSRGDRMQTLDFDTTCGRCHQHRRQIAASTALGVFNLPSIDAETITGSGLWLGSDAWPVSADDAVPLAPIMRMLLAADPQVEADFKTLRDAEVPLEEYLEDNEQVLEEDLEDNKQVLLAAARITWAVKCLIHDLLAGGTGELTRRLEAVFGTTLDEMQIDALLGQPSDQPRTGRDDAWHQALAAVQQTFLPTLNEDVQRYRADPSVLESADEEPGDEIERPEAIWSAGAVGWHVDPGTLMVQYRPTGHADPLLRSWLEQTLDRGGPSAPPAVAAVYEEFHNPVNGPGKCTKCHSVDVDATAMPPEYIVNWHAARPRNGVRSFNRFRHRPHLSFQQFSECTSCHALDSADAGSWPRWKESYEGLSPGSFEPSFAPLESTVCAECHTPDGAGAGCLNCHRYHVSGQRALPAAAPPADTASILRELDDPHATRFAAAAQDGHASPSSSAVNPP